MRYSANPSFILGFHGCDRETAERVVLLQDELHSSSNAYDWLGHGIYFWENNPNRALEWARKRSAQPELGRTAIEEPAVIGAIIDLGYCLSFMETRALKSLGPAYELLKQSKAQNSEPMPENRGGRDLVQRYLDCDVIQMIHASRQNAGLRPFDTVRAMFQEGEVTYPNAGFRQGNHIQVCVRNRQCIKGFFLPMDGNHSPGASELA